MAIGMEKWNEIENMDISLSLVRKMRKLRDATSDSEGESISGSEVEEMTDSNSDSEYASDTEHVGDPPQDIVVEVGDIKSPEEDKKEESAKTSAFTFCPVCPGRKFLTKKDEEDHMKTAKHLKRLERPAVLEKEEECSRPKKSKPAPKETKKEKVSNRKSRRAHLADSRS